ncbi:hypothetical protein Tco_1004375 [Tanacetum coccineum]|uniref:Uncharacterized protein n=1 Tax=Tanacetum coccineum TaxID=301880 RepID=A0ABQ5FC81_9ASTR
MDSISPLMDDILAFLIPISKGRSVVSIIARVVVAATTYFLWMELNSRLFTKKIMSVDKLVQSICSTVRLKLVTFRFKKTSPTSRKLLDMWKVPKQCIVHNGSAGLNLDNRRLDVFGTSVISRRHRVLCHLGFTFHYFRRRRSSSRNRGSLISNTASGVVMSADSAVTYTSVHSEARSWSIPSEDPYEEAARQLLEQAPHSPEYDLVPAEDEAPTPPLPPFFLSLRIRPPHTRAAMRQMRATAPSTYHSLLPSGTPTIVNLYLYLRHPLAAELIFPEATRPPRRGYTYYSRPGCAVWEEVLLLLSLDSQDPLWPIESDHSLCRHYRDQDPDSTEEGGNDDPP